MRSIGVYIISLVIMETLFISGCSLPYVDMSPFGEIQARIIDQNGIAVDNATLELRRRYKGAALMKPNQESNGEFKYTGLKKGNYTLAARAVGYCTTNLTVGVDYDSTKNVFLILYRQAAPHHSKYGFGRIRGRVTDAVRGDEMPGVSLWIKGTGIGAASSFDGHFTIEMIPPGEYTLRVSSIGYSTQEIENIIVNADETLQMDMNIQWEVLSIGQIGPRGPAPFDRHQTSNESKITEEEIETMPVSTLEDILKRMPGLR